jgi:aspartyl-tRNA(Asn)/glutamyl-tRNA(Gln) amidotransferase subunit A
MTIEEFGRRLRAREVTAAGLVADCLRRIDEGRHLNAFITVMADEARRQAEEADRELAGGRDRGPLHGVPIAVKDLIDVEGVPTTAASRVREGHVAVADATAITRLRKAGAVIICKKNLHEFAYGTTSEDSAFGPVRNPHDQARSPGGSSGGSAVAVAAGMALAALGTDTGGSIRIPAAACGIVGLKPTYGELPLDGVVPLARSFDHLGPLARSVPDAWIVYRALADTREDAPLRAAPTAGLRFGVPRSYFCDRLDRDVRACFDAALERLTHVGARVEDVEIPHAPATPAVYLHVHATEGSEYHARMLDAAGDRYMPMVRLRLEMGRYILSEDYIRARNACGALRGEVESALGDRDALILPALPIPAPPIGAESVEIDGAAEPVRALMLRCTQLFNMTGHPAISLPCGATPQGLPCGIQLVGRRFETDALMRVALAVENELRWAVHGTWREPFGLARRA